MNLRGNQELKASISPDTRNQKPGTRARTRACDETWTMSASSIVSFRHQVHT
jgi:hypothetical protein